MSKKTNRKPTAKSLANLTPGRDTDDYRPEYCQDLIDFMKKGYSLASFGAEVRKSRETLYQWMKKYPDFGEAHKIGKQAALKFFETMLINATMGTIPNQLKAMGSKKLDISAIIFALKTRFHLDYGEKQYIDHSSSDGSMSPKSLSDFYKDHAKSES
jgi:hypothetical protein